MVDYSAGLGDTGGTLCPRPPAGGGGACRFGRWTLVVVAGQLKNLQKQNRKSVEFVIKHT